MNKHELKTDPAVFQAVADGAKTYEIRFNDRDFAVGDELLLRETTRTGAEIAAGAALEYTGREITKHVSHVLTGYGLADGWAILSFAERATEAGTPATAVQMPGPARYSHGPAHDRVHLHHYTEKHMQAYGDARAEEAQREGYDEGYQDGRISILEEQRTAGGDAVAWAYEWDNNYGNGEPHWKFDVGLTNPLDPHPAVPAMPGYFRNVRPLVYGDAANPVAEAAAQAEPDDQNVLQNWLDNAKYLLDTTPGAVRHCPAGGAENLLSSLIANYMTLRNRVAAPTAQPTPPGALQQMANAGFDVAYGGAKVVAQPTPSNMGQDYAGPDCPHETCDLKDGQCACTRKAAQPTPPDDERRARLYAKVLAMPDGPAVIGGGGIAPMMVDAFDEAWKAEGEPKELRHKGIARHWFEKGAALRHPPVPNVGAPCAKCGGTGLIDDGEIDCYPNGEPFMCGPVKCVKDCPCCTSTAQPTQAGADPAIHDFREDMEFAGLLDAVFGAGKELKTGSTAPFCGAMRKLNDYIRGRMREYADLRARLASAGAGEKGGAA